MNKGILLGLPLVLICPMLLLVLGSGNANIEAVEAAKAAACSSAGTSSDQTGGSNGVGVMPTNITATPGEAVRGKVLVANANIKTRDGFNAGVGALVDAAPDFITLNEVGGVPLSQMRSAASGYGAYREETVDKSPGGGQSLNNAIMWRTDTWTMLDGGRVKIVAADKGFHNKKRFTWSRYATWGLFERPKDGAVIGVVSVHHMTSPYKFPKQWGNPPMTRVEQYGLGMDYLRDLVDVLSPYGPVLVGGDMNTVPKDGPNAAAPKMQAIGYEYTKDSGVIYNFHPAPVKAKKTWQISKKAVHSDHPALFTRLAMKGAGPTAPSVNQPTGTQPTGTQPTGCPPCPTFGNLGAPLLQQVASTTQGADAKVAASAAYQAGFRGEDLVIAVAIARVESTWNPKAINGTHYGLWQISEQHKGKVPGWDAEDNIYDPLLNARYAFALYSDRADAGEAKFADWIPFEKTDYRQYLDAARQAVAATGGGTTTATNTGCSTRVETGGVNGDRLSRLRQRAEKVIELSQRYASPCSVPGFDCQGVPFSGWSDACTAISMMIYGKAIVGSGDGGVRAYGSVVQGQQGSSWPPPPGAIVSWPYAGNGHVSIYLGDGQWVDNWPNVGHQTHDQVEKGAKAHWLLPPPSFEGTFLNDDIGASST